MKRRNFFGVMGGAVVAGPGLVKEAAAKAAQEMTLGGGRLLAGSGGNLPSGIAGYTSQAGSLFDTVAQITRGKDMLAKIAGLTADQRSKLKRDQQIYALDPDIASYQSLSMAAKVDWQRERQVERAINERTTVWQRLASGLNPHDDYPI